MIRDMFFRKPGSQLPVKLQRRQDDCGLACLSMVADFFSVPKKQRKALDPTVCKGKGMSVGTLVSIANALGFNTLSHRPGVEQFTEVSTPSILFWQYNHFVVLARQHQDGVLIHDPRVGRQLIHWADLYQYYSGVCVEFSLREQVKTEKAVSSDSYTRSYISLS